MGVKIKKSIKWIHSSVIKSKYCEQRIPESDGNLRANRCSRLMNLKVSQLEILEKFSFRLHFWSKDWIFINSTDVQTPNSSFPLEEEKPTTRKFSHKNLFHQLASSFIGTGSYQGETINMKKGRKKLKW